MNKKPLALAVTMAGCALLSTGCYSPGDDKNTESSNGYASEATQQHLNQLQQQPINYIPYSASKEVRLLDVNNLSTVTALRLEPDSALDYQILNFSANGKQLLKGRELLVLNNNKLQKISLSSGSVTDLSSEKSICRFFSSYPLDYSVSYLKYDESNFCTVKEGLLKSALVTPTGLEQAQPVDFTLRDVFISPSPGKINNGLHTGTAKLSKISDGTYQLVDFNNPDVQYPSFSITPELLREDSSNQLNHIYTYENGNDILIDINKKTIVKTSINELKQGTFPETAHTVLPYPIYGAFIPVEDTCLASEDNLYCSIHKQEYSTGFVRISDDGTFSELSLEIENTSSIRPVFYRNSAWFIGNEYRNSRINGQPLPPIAVSHRVTFEGNNYTSTPLSILPENHLISGTNTYQNSGEMHLLITSHPGDNTEEQSLHSVNLKSMQPDYKNLSSEADNFSFDIIEKESLNLTATDNILLLATQTVGSPAQLFSYGAGLSKKIFLGELPENSNVTAIQSVGTQNKLVFSANSDLWTIQPSKPDSLQQVTFDGDLTEEYPIGNQDSLSKK